MAGIKYTIRQNRLNKALFQGMKLEADGSVHTEETADSSYLVLPLLDSGVEDCPGGGSILNWHWRKTVSAICMWHRAMPEQGRK